MTVLCTCGLPKVMVGTVAVCKGHCDTPCADSPYCERCRQYSLATNQRVNAEHAREKRK